MYATRNEGKSVIAERFIRTLKNKICKYMNSISKNVHINKLNDVVNKFHSVIMTNIALNVPRTFLSNTPRTYLKHHGDVPIN